MYPTTSSSEVRIKDRRIELPDCFDFHAARELLRKIKSIAREQLPDTLRIDCRRTRHIDTAGLGSLLLVGEYLGVNRTIRIEGAHPQVGAMLAIARIEERLAGAASGQPDLRPCAACAQPVHGRCDGTLAEAADCRRTRPPMPARPTSAMPAAAWPPERQPPAAQPASELAGVLER